MFNDGAKIKQISELSDFIFDFCLNFTKNTYKICHFVILSLIGIVFALEKRRGKYRPSTGESSWLEYWENQTGKKATRCGATDCHSTGTLVGAHVKKVFWGEELYITPLCTSCNHRGDNFWVDTELVRVPSGL